MSKRKRSQKAVDAKSSNKQNPNKISAKQPQGLTTDAFQNVLARLGFGTPNLLEGTEYPLTRLSQNYQLINSLYRSHWIIRKIIDTIPIDACRNWLTITTQLDPEDLRKVNKVWRTRKLREKILLGLKWGRLYGGAAGLIMIEGHEDILDQPLDYDMIMPGGLKGLIIVDRWSGVYPQEELIDDPDDSDFGLPEYYQVTLEEGEVVRVHHSRILRFIGRELPYWEKLAEVYWGASEVEAVFDEIKKRDNSSWNIAQLIFLANLRVLKMGDMDQLLAIGDERSQQELYNTIQAQNWLMSNQGIYMLGKEDGFETHSYSFSGLNEIYESFMLDVAGAAEIPVTRLFGRSPAGMNATGESDMQNYYERVQQEQESRLAPVIDKLLPIIFMSELGNIPDDYEYTFDPIRTPDDKEIAELVDRKTKSVVEAYNAGLISQKVGMKELKQMSETLGMYSNITDEDIDEADDGLHQGEIGGGDLNYGEFTRGLISTKAPNRDSVSESTPNGVSKFRRILERLRRRI